MLTHWTEMNEHRRRSRRFYQLGSLRVKHVVNAFSSFVLVVFLISLFLTVRSAVLPDP